MEDKIYRIIDILVDAKGVSLTRQQCKDLAEKILKDIK